MHLFQTRHSRTTRSTTAAPRRRGFFHRKDNDRVVGGLSTRSTFYVHLPFRSYLSPEASLTNPNTTRAGRRQAKRELRAMVSLLTLLPPSLFYLLIRFYCRAVNATPMFHL